MHQQPYLRQTPRLVQDVFQPTYKVHLGQVLPHNRDQFRELAATIQDARARGCQVVAFLGGHVIKSGCGPIIARLVNDSWITHVACNGAAMVHDLEMALIGETSEDVESNLDDGTFGLSPSLDQIADVVSRSGVGLGRTASIAAQEAPYAEKSMLAHMKQTVTVHPMWGGDVFFWCPSFRPFHFAEKCHQDMIDFRDNIAALEGGVFLNFGSAVTGPELFLKALSWARNVHGLPRLFSTAVFDIQPVPEDWETRPFGVKDPVYYNRPLKTILRRCKPREAFYVQHPHHWSIPILNGLLR